jgi:hypothetical protein
MCIMHIREYLLWAWVSSTHSATRAEVSNTKLFSLNIASRSAFGRAALMRMCSPRQFLFVYFFQESLWQGDSGEWIFIEMIPQRGIGWEADTSASDSLFGDPLDEAPVGRQEHHSRETVKTQARSRPRHGQDPGTVKTPTSPWDVAGPPEQPPE